MKASVSFRTLIVVATLMLSTLSGLKEDAATDVWGSFTVSGSQITIIDEGGEYMSDGPGVYSFLVSESSLTRTVVSDAEDGRKIVVQGIWSKS